MHIVSPGTSALRHARGSAPALLACGALIALAATFVLAPGHGDDSPTATKLLSGPTFIKKANLSDSNGGRDLSIVVVHDEASATAIMDALAANESFVMPSGSGMPPVSVVLTSVDSEADLRAALMESDSLLSETGGEVHVYEIPE